MCVLCVCVCCVVRAVGEGVGGMELRRGCHYGWWLLEFVIGHSSSSIIRI